MIAKNFLLPNGRENSGAAWLGALSDLTDAQLHELQATCVMIVGLGNIGGHLPGYLPYVEDVILVDRDKVELSNRWNQVYSALDVGRPKVHVQAERLRALRPQARITTYHADLSAVPWREFARADIILAGLDSLQGRQRLAIDRAWPVGTTVIDGAVGWPWLGRVQVIRPGPQSGCLSCQWNESHYRLSAFEEPCNPAHAPNTPPTRSPAFLGAAVASVMAAEAVQVRLGARGPESRQIDINLGLPKWTVSRMRRSSECRFDHALIDDRRLLPGGFEGATVVSLQAFVQAEFSESATLTFGRPFFRDAFGPQATVTCRELSAWHGRHLRDLGCGPADWILVRSESERAFVMLEPLTLADQEHVS